MTQKYPLLAILLLTFLGCLSKQPTLTNTASFLDQSGKADVEAIEKEFNRYTSEPGYNSIRSVRNQEIGKELEVFIEAYSWGRYSAYLFIQTNRDAKYYYVVTSALKYNQLSMSQFNSLIEKSGGINGIFALTSKPSNSGCSDAATYRVTVSDRDRRRIIYYYCWEPPLVLNLLLSIQPAPS